MKHSVTLSFVQNCLIGMLSASLDVKKTLREECRTWVRLWRNGSSVNVGKYYYINSTNAGRNG